MFDGEWKYFFFQPRKALLQQLLIYFLAMAVVFFAVPLALDAGITNQSESISQGLSFMTSPRAAAESDAQVRPLISTNGWDLLRSILSVILLMIPVTWIYRGTRRMSGLDQSMIETLLVLPVVVTGVIAIVQYSLPLAFALAGVFAGVQFRNRLKRIADAHYLFVSIAMSLSAGVGKFDIAYVISCSFCFLVFAIWRLDYGGESADRHLRRPDLTGACESEEEEFERVRNQTLKRERKAATDLPGEKQ